jgi:hypothetical protein
MKATEAAQNALELLLIALEDDRFHTLSFQRSQSIRWIAVLAEASLVGRSGVSLLERGLQRIERDVAGCPWTHEGSNSLVAAIPAQISGNPSGFPEVRRRHLKGVRGQRASRVQVAVARQRGDAGFGQNGFGARQRFGRACVDDPNRSVGPGELPDEIQRPLGVALVVEAHEFVRGFITTATAIQIVDAEVRSLERVFPSPRIRTSQRPH